MFGYSLSNYKRLNPNLSQIRGLMAASVMVIIGFKRRQRACPGQSSDAHILYDVYSSNRML